MVNEVHGIGYKPSSSSSLNHTATASSSFFSRYSIKHSLLSQSITQTDRDRDRDRDRAPSFSMYEKEKDKENIPLTLRFSDIYPIPTSQQQQQQHLLSQYSWPWPPLDPLLLSGFKRSSDAIALYDQTSHNNTSTTTTTTMGQSEAWYSNSLAKRPRFESRSNLPVYPQRPGEKDCAHYMLTRTCRFGDTCKFDHPIWVPEGGIPDWKEVPLLANCEDLPQKPGEPDCPYFLKTQRCKFGSRCKFNHPKDIFDPVGADKSDVLALPERPSEPLCAFYVKTGKCKFGGNCKFHHPKDIQIAPFEEENGNGEQSLIEANTDGRIGDLNVVKPPVSFSPALMHNTKGLPIRLGEVDCPFYLKTGSCKYGTTCRYNHPDRNGINQSAAAIVYPSLASAANMSIGIVNPSTSIYQAIDPRLIQTVVGSSSTIYPQRPGQIECDYYMKTGDCKFGERCKFHHPIDRSAPNQVAQQNVKLTLAGLPRREDAIICPYYLKTGTCKYGSTCKFDHPPPGEVMAMAAIQSVQVKGEERMDESVQEQ